MLVIVEFVRETGKRGFVEGTTMKIMGSGKTKKACARLTPTHITDCHGGMNRATRCRRLNKMSLTFQVKKYPDHEARRTPISDD